MGTRDELTRKGSGNAIITSDGEETQQKEARKREREEKEKLSEVKLREYLQESCFQAISALLNQLNEKLSSLAASTVSAVTHLSQYGLTKENLHHRMKEGEKLCLVL